MNLFREGNLIFSGIYHQALYDEDVSVIDRLFKNYLKNLGPHSEAEAPKKVIGESTVPVLVEKTPQVKDVGNGQIALWNYWMKNYVPLAKPCFLCLGGM